MFIMFHINPTALSAYFTQAHQAAPARENRPLPANFSQTHILPVGQPTPEEESAQLRERMRNALIQWSRAQISAPRLTGSRQAGPQAPTDVVTPVEEPVEEENINSTSRNPNNFPLEGEQPAPIDVQSQLNRNIPRRSGPPPTIPLNPTPHISPSPGSGTA